MSPSSSEMFEDQMSNLNVIEEFCLVLELFALPRE